MENIKIKEKVKGTIKTLDKSANAAQKFKNNIVITKEKAEESYNSKTNDESAIEYADNKITATIGYGTTKGINSFNKYGKKSFEITRNNIDKTKVKIEDIKSKVIKKKQEKALIKSENNIGRTIKGKHAKTGKFIKGTRNNTQKMIKTTEKVAKTTEKTAKATTKALQKTAQSIKATAKASVAAAKVAIKAFIMAIKGIIAATKALIALIVAGGWIAILIIIIICLIALIVGSVFGVFFSSEETDGTTSMSNVVKELNTEFMNKITTIQNNNPYDEYDINGTRADWKDIIAVYSVKTNGGDNSEFVYSLDDNKVAELKKIFWEMNEISYTKDVEKKTEVILHLTWTEYKEIEYTKLHINLKHKTADEMAEKYNFNETQKEQLKELLREDYNSMWASVIYGTSGSTDIVNVALAQLGNVGGQPYWSWYGFESRVEWCACFVSWCANECGYIEAGIIPKFAGCQSEGVSWFKACGLWQDNGYIPKSRRYYLL